MTGGYALGSAMRTLTARVAAHAVDTREAADDLVARAMWSCLVEPGDRVAGRVVSVLGADAALHAVIARDRRAAEAADIPGGEWRKALARWSPRLDESVLRRSLEAAVRAGVSLMTPHDERWPRLLADLGDHAPLCLWVRGDPGRLRASPAVAIVGARAASPYGEHVAVELAAELAGRGVAIVSGAAYGIDGAAHRATLAARGRTIAMLAGGVDRPYPSGHTDLIDRIAATGAVASEVPCGSAPTRWRFLQRNRLIATLADAVVVVEAGARSGSLNTAGHAADVGRPIGAVPGPVTSPSSAGCHRLLREYPAQCITSANDVMELMGLAASRADDMDGHAGRRDDERIRLLDALSMRSRRSAEDIARRAGLSVRDVESLLGLLRLEGLVDGDEGGWRRVASDDGR